MFVVGNQDGWHTRAGSAMPVWPNLQGQVLWVGLQRHGLPCQSYSVVNRALILSFSILKCYSWTSTSFPFLTHTMKSQIYSFKPAFVFSFHLLYKAFVWFSQVRERFWGSAEWVCWHQLGHTLSHQWEAVFYFVNPTEDRADTEQFDRQKRQLGVSHRLLGCGHIFWNQCLGRRLWQGHPGSGMHVQVGIPHVVSGGGCMDFEQSLQFWGLSLVFVVSVPGGTDLYCLFCYFDLFKVLEINAWKHQTYQQVQKRGVRCWQFERKGGKQSSRTPFFECNSESWNVNQMNNIQSLLSFASQVFNFWMDFFTEATQSETTDVRFPVSSYQCIFFCAACSLASDVVCILIAAHQEKKVMSLWRCHYCHNIAGSDHGNPQGAGSKLCAGKRWRGRSGKSLDCCIQRLHLVFNGALCS